ncbi:pre-mRNA-splicing factor ISY1 homolog [Ruditapes philippinarum]|uniref:pre-mRNA-splicing factor ISY1 homolog n=1 Tax=Ruditapes philippinarum TaxID=129788 RepID=UPI00295B7C5C|nr:pre-mRNA-splicing factor ISY1 homolog [Ruditapes philippinarum]
MARNSEKAMTALARWRAAHLDDKKEVERRPYLATECDDVKKAEKFRRQIIGEISKKVAQIQNAGLGEFKLRDINDEINKLLREKGHWEDRIKELDGPDYRKIGPKMLDHEGKEVPGNRGYKYFGAAKDLPGVRELFEQEPPPPPRKTRGELMKDIDADYYGYRDEDDGVIIPLEKEAEKKAIAEKVRAWKEKQEQIARGEKTEDSEETSEVPRLFEREEEDMDADVEEPSTAEESDMTHFIAHVDVPSQKQIEEALLERKKIGITSKNMPVMICKLRRVK